MVTNATMCMPAHCEVVMATTGDGVARYKEHRQTERKTMKGERKTERETERERRRQK